MSTLALYNKQNQTLGAVKFLEESLSFPKIRTVNGHELSKALSHWITETSLLLGIKDAISDINKKDVIEMIVTEFKSLSVDELYYAFKLERYGSLEPLTKGESPITKHFQLFNAEYVSQVLRKYKNWKRKKLIEHNVQVKSEVVTATEKEKQYWINKGVSSCLDFFEINGFIEDGKTYVYEILYDDGHLSKDPEYKRQMYAAAQDVLRLEYTAKKASSKEENASFKSILENIEKQANGKVIAKAKELVLNSFFRQLVKDEVKTNDFKEKYKVKLI